MTKEEAVIRIRARFPDLNLDERKAVELIEFLTQGLGMKPPPRKYTSRDMMRVTVTINEWE